MSEMPERKDSPKAVLTAADMGFHVDEILGIKSKKEEQSRRDGYIQAAMHCVRSWFLYGEHDNSETAAKAVEIADAVMAAADKDEKESNDGNM